MRTTRLERSLPTALLFLACLAGAGGCLRQTGTPAAPATMSPHVGPLAEAPEPPIVETDRPGAVFLLNGAPFCFAGTNNYYLIYKSRKMVDDVLEATKSMGLKVIRIWGYLDRGSLDGAVANVDGPGEKNGVYFQYWDPAQKRPAYNDGETGINHLDYVLDKAKKLDLKVMLVLTNNWKDFGGMDQYLVWYGLHEHQQFYTDPAVGQAYKNWVAHLVARKNSISGVVYKDDPTIFGWELANEPRCTNSGAFDNGAACNPPMLTQWVAQMSSYIKSIDPNHMVSVGDEGFFADGKESHYNGAEGTDHKAFLGLPHVDFGTFHLYPESWGHRTSWGSQWIEDHIQAAQQAGKPTLLEEYGIIARRNPAGVITDDSRRRRVYARWHDVVRERGASAALFWMLAGVDDEPDAVSGMYPDYDHFELYSADAEAQPIRAFAASMATDGRVCDLYRKMAPEGAGPKSPFVTTSAPPERRQADLRPLDVTLEPSAVLDPALVPTPSAVAN
jgi:mannan endo-1,4-beta-mannosidase